MNRNAYRDCRTKTGITPLFQACRENHISIVELLLEHGAGVNTPFPNSRENPLTLCAEKGHQELVGLLLTKGAVIDCQTKKGCTPIFLSCKEGHLEISDVLLKQGANVETADCRGNTPIMAAFKNGHVIVSFRVFVCLFLRYMIYANIYDSFNSYYTIILFYFCWVTLLFFSVNIFLSFRSLNG